MTAGSAPGTAEIDRPLPPITEMAVASLILIVIGAIYMAAALPKKPTLAISVVLVVVSGALMIANVISLSRLQEFSWDTFLLVGKWTLLAYVIIAGMLEYVFFIDHTRGSQLLILTLMLIIFAVDIPLLLAFSVARYQPTKP